jgi:hypothetical protein
MPPRAAVTDLYALDFDGVVCDSVGESAQSAWRVRGLLLLLLLSRCRVLTAGALRRARAAAQAAEKLWPELFATPGAAAERPRVLEEMRAVRPVVETGYENLVQVRLLLEQRPGARPDDMLQSWGCVRCVCAHSHAACVRATRSATHC